MTAEERPALTDPEFNLREIVKQFILLEDHLVHPYKFCLDCIRKHLMTVEALAEEIPALEPGTVVAKTGEMLGELARAWMVNIVDEDRPVPDIAKDVRTIRKQMAEDFHDPRPSNERVASRFIIRNFPCPHQ